MIEANDLNDGAILQATRVNQDGSGKRQFEIVLPDGFVVKSEWLPPESADRYVAKWCESVRGQFEARLEEKVAEARAKSRAGTAVQSPTQSVPTTTIAVPNGQVDPNGREQPTTQVEVESPEELVKRTIVRARERLALAAERFLAAEAERDSASSHLEKWEMVARSLKIELEEKEDEVKPEEPAGDSDGDTDTVGVEPAGDVGGEG